jgi:HK97 family phage major capsid protein
MNLKKLLEKRAALIKQLEDLFALAEKEERAFTEDEQKNYDTIKAEVDSLDKTIASFQESRKLTKDVVSHQTEEKNKDELEMRSFVNYIRGKVEERDDANMTKGQNGAVIKTSIINKIIDKVKELSPIYELATKYFTKGNIQIPYCADDENETGLTMAYAEEFAELESTATSLKSITLGSFLAGVLTKISKSLLNNSDIDLFNYVINKMGEAIADWLEKELLFGTPDKITGLDTGVTQKITAASETAIKADELMDVQDEVPDIFQGNCVWIMNRRTRNAIRKLKDNDGNYLLNRDLSSKWNYTLLGKDIYTSSNMPIPAAGKTVIFYGDFSGLAIRITENMELQILREKYATQHAIGVVGWMELDSKVENAQKLSKLVMKAAAQSGGSGGTSGGTGETG